MLKSRICNKSLECNQLRANLVISSTSVNIPEEIAESMTYLLYLVRNLDPLTCNTGTNSYKGGRYYVYSRRKCIK